MRARRSLFGKIARVFALAALALICIFIAAILFDTVAPPVSTLMIAREIEGRNYAHFYVRLNDVSPAAVAAVVASEDASFCRNDGVDRVALHAVLIRAGHGGPRRGASTITMQTAKNLFLWPGRSAVRKGLEIGVALFLGKAWSKRRTLEAYLNVAEWGDGIFGIEAAARHYFRKSANEINAREGALLAASLPNPIRRDPARPTQFQRRLAAAIQSRAHATPELLSCLAR
jgi:monofunctional biosynthetic peptidoglycan transglycosylase